MEKFLIHKRRIFVKKKKKGVNDVALKVDLNGN